MPILPNFARPPGREASGSTRVPRGMYSCLVFDVRVGDGHFLGWIFVISSQTEIVLSEVVIFPGNTGLFL